MTEPNGIPRMLCVYQSFTSLAGVYTDILFQSVLKGTLGRTGDVNTVELAAQVQSTRDCVQVPSGHGSTETMVRRDFRSLCGRLPYLIKNQIDCSPSRLLSNHILKDFPWWESTASSSNLFQCFISLSGEKKTFPKM